jgi:choline dehydrogenase-like flavoprotein
LRTDVEEVFGPGTQPIVSTEHVEEIAADIAIVGSGMGGATAAYALRNSGARVLVLEQGDFLPHERENWSARALHVERRYANSDHWIDVDGKPFAPASYHYVGGCTKFYGAALTRFRERDFDELEHRDGVSPAWPISYRDLEPWYVEAERLFWVHGGAGDPTEPWRSEPFPFPPIPHETAIARLSQRLAAQGLKPFPLPQSIDWRTGGRCVRCRTCDSFPCLLDAKGDAEICAMRPALASDNVRLCHRTKVVRVVLGCDGKIDHLYAVRDGKTLRIAAERFVLAAGAVNSAALLLRSGGLANSSDQVGRNYMAHNCSFVVATRLGRDLEIEFEKTMGLNDWYFAGDENDFPLGNVQSLGKVQGVMIKAERPWIPLGVLEWISRRTVDFFAETEDLPDPENRIVIDADDRIHLIRQANNLKSHEELVQRLRKALRRAGFPLIFADQVGTDDTTHQCGTLRMGLDPGSSVVDPFGRSHDIENLWIVDASVFPSSAATNPSLTIAANSLRVVAEGGLAG